MSVIFNQVVRHDRQLLMPGPALAFEDADAEPYFVALGWADITADTPVMTYGQDEISVDPLARVAETGQYVLPDRAAAVTPAALTDGDIAPEDGTHG